MERFDIKAFDKGMVYPPKQAKSRIDSIKENRNYLKKGYHRFQNTHRVSVKVLGTTYSETIYESHIYSLIIKRLLAIHLNLLPIFKLKGVEQTVPQSFWESYNKNFFEFLGTGYGFLYIYKKGQEIRINNIPSECVYKIYEDEEFKGYMVGTYIYAKEDIFKEKDPIQVKLSYIQQGSVEDIVYNYDSRTKTLGEEIDRKPYPTHLNDYNLIEYKYDMGESDFEQYKGSILEYEKALTSINLLIQVGLSPIVEVPMGLLLPDEDGKVTSSFTTGGVVESTGENPIRVIGLDLHIEDLQKHKTELFQDIAIQSELGALLKADFGGSNISAEGLKIMLKSALDKSSRICDCLDIPTKRVLSIIFQLQGESSTVGDIEIVWRDGINKIESEEVMQ